MRPVVVTEALELGAPPHKIWPLLTQTDRANRALDGSPIVFRPIEKGLDSAARFLGETVTSGFRLVYEEMPFEWVHERSFGVRRIMRTGPIVSLSIRWTFEPHAGGTRAQVTLELQPRHWIFWPVVFLNARKYTSQLARFAADIDAHVRGEGDDPFSGKPPDIDERRLQQALDELRREGVDEPLAERLAQFLGRAPDGDVVRMRPFELADSWGEERRDVLRAFLRGVPAGLVELRWGVLCPSCRTSSEEYAALGELSAEGHCQFCDITFDLDLDRAVEAMFVPHEGLRRVSNAAFCTGGPGRTPHVLVQANLGVGESRSLEAPSKPGRYRVFARGGASATLEVDDGGSDALMARVEQDAVRPAHLLARPGSPVAVLNAGESARHVKIERLDYANAAATAHFVSTLPEFRSLFSSDLLKRSTPLKVARVAVLFSDLTGSTALYSNVGDAAAFRLVDDHFDVLRAVVDAAGGVFIKTMGDAMMAGFVDARDAARAGLEVLRQFEAFRKDARHGAHVGIKLGLYAGPCYVVTANGVLDYFGQTVNIASRVQHLAAAGELVLPARELESIPEIGDMYVREPFEARVKGVDTPLDLVRIRPVG